MKRQRYTIECKELNSILCTHYASSKRYRQEKGNLDSGMKPYIVCYKKAKEWADFLTEDTGNKWNIYEI